MFGEGDNKNKPGRKESSWARVRVMRLDMNDPRCRVSGVNVVRHGLNIVTHRRGPDGLAHSLRQHDSGYEARVPQWRARVTGWPAFRRTAMNDLHDLPTWLPLRHESTLRSGNTSMGVSRSSGSREQDSPLMRPPPAT